MKKIQHITACVIIVWVGMGCAGNDWTRERKQQTERLRRDIQRNTETARERYGRELTLSSALQLALTNNLNVRIQSLNAALAATARKQSFAQFLPQINASYNLLHPFQQLEIQPGDTARPIALDTANIHLFNASITQPLFVPQSWFVYAAYSRQAEIGKLAEEYTRQMTTLQVTTLYFNGITGMDALHTLQSQLQAAEHAVQDIQRYVEQGILTQPHWDTARAHAISLRAQIRQTEADLSEARAHLFQALGLDPFSDWSLARGGTVIKPEGTLETLVTEALLNHPALYIEDRDVAVAREQVRGAVAAFLPTLSVAAAGPYISAASVVNAWNPYAGLAAGLNVFNGFARLHSYRAARLRQQQAAEERDQACLTTMVQVLGAWNTLGVVELQLESARHQYEAAAGIAKEYAHRLAQGTTHPTEWLDAMSHRDAAEFALAQLKYRKEYIHATLATLTGHRVEANDTVK